MAVLRIDMGFYIGFRYGGRTKIGGMQQGNGPAAVVRRVCIKYAYIHTYIYIYILISLFTYIYTCMYGPY